MSLCPHESSLDVAFAKAFEDDTFNALMPGDVSVICSDGHQIKVHKPLLFIKSGYYRGLVSFNSGLVDTTKLDLSSLTGKDGFESAVQDNVLPIVQYMYKNQEGFKFRDLDHLTDIIYLANYLLVDTLVDHCASLLEKHLEFLRDTNSEREEVVMCVYHLAMSIDHSRLKGAAETHLRSLNDIPKEFSSVEIATMRRFVQKPEEFRFRCLSSNCRMGVEKTEELLMDLIVKFVRFNVDGRLRYAEELFCSLRLVYVVKYMNFAEFGLPQLEDADAYPLLHYNISQAVELYHAENFYESGFHGDLWMPRPDTVKQSILTQILGKTRRIAKPVDKSIVPWAAPKRGNKQNMPIVLTRDPEVRLRQLIFYQTDHAGSKIIGGISVRWSDGSTDVAGQVSNVKHEVSLGLYDSICIEHVAAKEFLEGISYRISYAGRRDSGELGVSLVKTLGVHRSLDSLVSRKKLFADPGTRRVTERFFGARHFLDGLCCNQIWDGVNKRYLVSGVQFKVSVMTSEPRHPYDLVSDYTELKLSTPKPAWSMALAAKENYLIPRQHLLNPSVSQSKET